MGEMADYTLDLAWDCEGWVDEEDDGKPERGVMCKYCGQTGLHWGQHNGKWRLYDFDAVHSCSSHPSSKWQGGRDVDEGTV